MRSLLLGWFLVALCGCEQRFSSNPPPLGPESFASASPADGGDVVAQDASLPPADAADSRSTVAESHALIVTACASQPRSCPASVADASADFAYRVVFGSGRGVVRSREQALTDLYQGLRDRTASGERIDAEVVRRDTTRRPASVRLAPRRSTMQADQSADPLARCASFLLDLVDENGEVTLDTVHWSGVTGCTVSEGASAGDGGSSQCLIKEPERFHGPGKSGFTW